MSQISEISVILPSLNPGKKILNVIENLKDRGFDDIIVINDGSKDEFLPIFEEAAKIKGCTILNHDVNKGKGAALKTGMKYFLENCPDYLGVVTVDDDGQHLPEDVKQCAGKMAESEALVLGARDFNDPSIPVKSRIGNRTMIKLFNLIGLRITDSQTGLRAIPKKYLNTFINVSGSRFEYETNMLIAAKRHCFNIAEVPISTIYFEGNKNTHFKALKDSLKVVIQFVKYALGSLLSWVIDILSFYVLLNFLSWSFIPENWNVIFLCTVIARVISSVFNFIFNKSIVFKHKKNILKTALKYYILVCFSMVLSGGLVAFCSNVLNIESAVFITLVKIIVDTGIFIMNYFIQKKVVFK